MAEHLVEPSSDRKFSIEDINSIIHREICYGTLEELTDEKY